jgi:hypothetical protein
LAVKKRYAVPVTLRVGVRLMFVFRFTKLRPVRKHCNAKH